VIDMAMVSDVERLELALGARSYDIVIGSGVIEQAGEAIRAVAPTRRCFVVSDETVAPLYLPRLAESLEGAGLRHDALVVPAGESSKSFARLGTLLDDMLALGPERGTAIVALGGGVVGDLAGFAASVLLRGVPFVQIPTTLLSQVDSSVGGKTGINTKQGKNLVGAFHQPKLVLADVDSLDSLPRRQLLAGYAELVKHALLGDRGFFDWLVGNGAAALNGDKPALIHAVRKSCEMKAAIVSEDEREAGRRALLNLGHTFGHALETEAGYGETLLHGEAVAIGICMAFDLSAELGLCATADAARVAGHLSEVGLPTRPPALAAGPWDPARLMATIGHDKKVRDGRPTYVLVRGIGHAFTTQDVAPEAVETLLAKAVAA